MRDWRVLLITDDRGARYAGDFPKAVECKLLPASTFARGGLWKKIVVPFVILFGVLRAFRLVLKTSPSVVLGFGGYPSLPALIAGWLLRVPMIIHEQNGVLGRVNRLFARKVAHVACGTWPTDLPKGVEGIYTGNPIRPAVKARAAAGYIPPGDYPMKILVFGGSQGARILSAVVPEAIISLPEDIRKHISVVQQAREEDLSSVVEAYHKAGIRAHVAPFIEDISKEIAEAQLVIARAGASTVADISVIGRPAIFVPYAAATHDHQTANAKGLVEAGAAVLISEKDFSVAHLSQHIVQILSHPDAAHKMVQKAVENSQPEAAHVLADLVCRLGSEE